MAINRIVVLSLFVIALFVGAFQQTKAETRCPGGSNDECDQWSLQEADKQLAAVVAAALGSIDGFAHPDTRQEAKDKLAEAHRNWISLRGLDCQSESAFNWLRSARTRQGYIASCMRSLTVERIAKLKQRYLLKN